MSKPFTFKQFTIHQDKCAMKIGTDGVLLGAWAAITSNPNAILDIGSGTGVVALQLAQRSMAETIDAIELDAGAYEQCVENFEASPWSDRLFCYHASIQEYASEMEEEYDLIISNPPFFVDGPTSGDFSRDTARFDDSLPLEHLLVCALHLLSAEGRFALIISSDREQEIMELAQKHELHLSRRCRLQGRPDAAFKRSLLEFTIFDTGLIEEKLSLRDDTGNWSDDYLQLVDPFYLDLSSS